MKIKEKDGKIVMRMKGHCNPEKPNQKINIEYEMDLDM